MENGRSILVDVTKCIGCRSCEQACKQLHGFPLETESKLSVTALTVIRGARGQVRAAHVYALPGPGVRVRVPGWGAQEDGCRAGDI
jgi:Fe-S-cluster-containing dehydrogenase component